MHNSWVYPWRERYGIIQTKCSLFVCEQHVNSINQAYGSIIKKARSGPQKMDDDLPPGHEPHEVSLVKDSVRVDVSWIGEGRSGDYDPEDPSDMPLYRFEIYSKDEEIDPEEDPWSEVEDSSYCTNLDTSLPVQALEAFAQIIMSEVYDSVSSGQSIKRCCEDLSWTPMSRFDPEVAAARSEDLQDKTPGLPPRACPGPRI